MREYVTYEDVDFNTQFPCSSEIVSEIVGAIRMEGRPNARVNSFQLKDGRWTIEVRNFWGYDIDLKRAVFPFLKYLEETPLHQVICEEEEGRYFWTINNGIWKILGGHSQPDIKDHREFHVDKINSNHEQLFIDVDMFTISITRSDQKLTVEIYEGDVCDACVASLKAETGMKSLDILGSNPGELFDGMGLEINQAGKVDHDSVSHELKVDVNLK